MRFLKVASQAIAQEFHWRDLVESGIMIAPIVFFSIITGDELLVSAALVAICSALAGQKSGATLLGVLALSLCMTVGFLLLFFSFNSPFIFTALCMLMAASTILLESYNHALRTPGNYAFVAALYLACDLAEVFGGQASASNALRCLPYFALGAGCAVCARSLRYPRLWARKEGGDDGLLYQLTHFFSKETALQPGRENVRPFLIAISISVGIVAFVTDFGHMENGQWAIWSAASVITSDIESSRKRTWDRTIGATAGVLVGALGSFFIPHTPLVYDNCILFATMLIGAFRTYILSIFTRIALVTMALIAASGSLAVGTERVFGTMLGSVLGSVVLFSTLALYKRMGRPAKNPSKRAKPLD